MNEYLLKMLSIQKETERNSKKQTLFRSIAILCVLIVFFCSFYGKTPATVAFIVSLIVLIGLYVLDSNFANKNHSLEVEIYLLELGHLRSEKEAAEKEGKTVSDNWMDSLSKPDEKAKLPMVYYFVLMVICALIWIL